MKFFISLLLAVGVTACSPKATEPTRITVASYAEKAYSCPMHPDLVTNDPNGICLACQMKTATPVAPPVGKTHNVVVFPGGQGQVKLKIDSSVEVPLVDRGDYYTLDLVLQKAGHHRLEALNEQGLLAATAVNL